MTEEEIKQRLEFLGGEFLGTAWRFHTKLTSGASISVYINTKPPSAVITLDPWLNSEKQESVEAGEVFQIKVKYETFLLPPEISVTITRKMPKATSSVTYSFTTTEPTVERFAFDFCQGLAPVEVLFDAIQDKVPEVFFPMKI